MTRTTGSSAPPTRKTAARLINVQAADVILVDLAMAALDVVPRWERRRSDVPPTDAPPATDAYAVLRGLQVDATAARYPMVVFKDESTDGRPHAAASLRHRRVPSQGRTRPRCSPGSIRCFATSCCPRARSSPIPRDGLESLEPEDEHAPMRTRVPAARCSPSPSPRPDARRSRSRRPSPPTFLSTACPRALRQALLVDPDAAYRRFLKNALAVHGFTVHEASTSEEALRIATARRPWLILTEVNLPDENGFELCRRVRAHSLLAHTPLAFLSDWDDYEKRYYGMKLGADDYFTKPIPARELLIRVQLILKRYSDIRTRTRNGSGLEGGIELIGAPGVLQMCHISQLTGVFTARAGTRIAQIRFRDGELISAHCDGFQDAEADLRLHQLAQGPVRVPARQRRRGTASRRQLRPAPARGLPSARREPTRPREQRPRARDRRYDGAARYRDHSSGRAGAGTASSSGQ